MKEYKTLAIIGNGFDLAHGYKTGFRDFVYDENVKQHIGDTLIEYRQLLRNYACRDLGVSSNWYDFEIQAKEIIKGLVYACLDNNKMFTKTEPMFSDLERFNEVYKRIIEELKCYLRIATQSDVRCISNLKRDLRVGTFALNFNYTSTINKYECDNYYVHGSLDEDEIVLGYDSQEDNSMIFRNGNGDIWYKIFPRERLEFFRYINSKGIVDRNQQKCICNEFLEAQRWEGTGRGLDPEVLDGMNSSVLIKEFRAIHKATSYGETPCYEINKEWFKPIDSIVVIGHCLKTDKDYLSAVLKMLDLNEIQEVKIYTFDGEDALSLSKKVNYFLRGNIDVDAVKIACY